MKHTITVLVENQAGVLSKVSGLFSRRAFNIESLAVGETENPAVSRMTILVEGDDYTVEQIEKQLNKIIPVIKVKTLAPGSFVNRTLAMIKVAATGPKRAEIIQIAEMTGAHIVDAAKSTITLEITDTEEKISTLLSLLSPFGIREMVRTGTIAIERGDGVTLTPVARKKTP